jgi:hypothetical protein
VSRLVSLTTAAAAAQALAAINRLNHTVIDGSNVFVTEDRDGWDVEAGGGPASAGRRGRLGAGLHQESSGLQVTHGQGQMPYELCWGIEGGGCTGNQKGVITGLPLIQMAEPCQIGYSA